MKAGDTVVAKKSIVIDKQCLTKDKEYILIECGSVGYDVTLGVINDQGIKHSFNPIEHYFIPVEEWRALHPYEAAARRLDLEKEPDWSVSKDSDMHLSPFQKIDKLEEENKRLRERLEKLEPKPKVWEGWLYMDDTGCVFISKSDPSLFSTRKVIAKKLVTISEGEGING